MLPSCWFETSVAAIPALKRPGVGDGNAVAGTRDCITRIILAIGRVIEIASASAAFIAVGNVCIVAKLVVVAVILAVVKIGCPGHINLPCV